MTFAAKTHVGNYGRTKAFETFAATLREFRGRDHVSEIDLRDGWLGRLRSDGRLTTNGWYDPPVDGMAVLFAHQDDVGRVSFQSLRLPEFGPSDVTMNWSTGMMYAYCSPVDRSTGLAGDFGITLYFGEDPEIRSFFRRCFRVTARLVAEIAPAMTSSELFGRSEAVFEAAGLCNTIASITDSTPLDLGHTMPGLDVAQLLEAHQLSDAMRDAMRADRRFVGTSSDWALSDVRQFTVEPQLVDPSRPDLPQISFHYVVSVMDDSVTVLRECDALLGELDLV